MQPDPQHGESNNPKPEKCCSKAEGTTQLWLRFKSHSLGSASRMLQVWLLLSPS